MVETFTLCSWSPPVPTTSMASGPTAERRRGSIMASIKTGHLIGPSRPLAVSAVQKTRDEHTFDRDLRGSRSVRVEPLLVPGSCRAQVGSSTSSANERISEGRESTFDHSDTILVDVQLPATTTISRWSPRTSTPSLRVIDVSPRWNTRDWRSARRGDHVRRPLLYERAPSGLVSLYQSDRASSNAGSLLRDGSGQPRPQRSRKRSIATETLRQCRS